MWESIQWIIAVGGGSLIAIAGQVLFLKPNKRIKEAEADAKEIENLNTKTSYLQNQIDFLSTRLDVVLKDLGASNERERTLQSDLSTSELKRQKGKNCIAQAHGCCHVSEIEDCPVLERQKKQEEEYLASLENSNKRKNNEAVE